MISNKRAVEILEEAASIVLDGWCQLNYAQNQSNLPVHPCYLTASKWCMLGAIDKVTSGMFVHEIKNMIHAEFGVSVAVVNDRQCQTPQEASDFLLHLAAAIEANENETV